MKRGFTLIELIVAIALLTLVTFGIAYLFPRGVQMVQRSSSITIAVNLAQAQIETVLAENYQTVSVGTYEARHTVRTGFDRQTQVSFIDPTSLVPSDIDTGLKRIEVTVFYTTPFGEKSTSLSTFIARR